jgi:hypothetical protein
MRRKGFEQKNRCIRFVYRISLQARYQRIKSDADSATQ